MNIFKPGKITIVLDGGAGSSAKGIRGANIWKSYKEHHTTFANNTFMSNAAHTIAHSDVDEVVHQCLSSITTLGTYEKQYISPGAVTELDALLAEIETCNKYYPVNKDNLKIHPNTAFVTKVDVDYERGMVDFEGNKKSEQSSANLGLGSTLHGVGAARARRILRRPDALIAKNVPELSEFISNTHEEMMDRLSNNESGLGEIAQGYQLSLYSRFYPKTTSRNCSVSAFLDDSLLPPCVCGPVIVNFRTFPIRVNNNKFVRISDGTILTWDQFQSTPDNDKRIIKGNSGDGYPDQHEMTWEEISASAGDKIAEITTLTKLPRRVFSFSKVNLMEALKFNNTGDDVYASVNFMNYVDVSVKGKRTLKEVITPKVAKWIKENVWNAEFRSFLNKNNIRFSGLFIGTWKTVDDSVFLSTSDLRNIN